MPWETLAKIGKVFNPSLTDRVVGKVQEKTDRYFDQKREEFVAHARIEAEQFITEQMVLIEAKVDAKMNEIEQRLDAMIEKEVRNKLRILIYTLTAMVVMSLVSLGYLYLKRRIG